MPSRYLSFIANPHFWVVVALLAIGMVLHYPQQLLGISSPSVFSALGLTRHALERIFMLLPISYAGFIFSTRAGLISLVAATAIMLPRIFLISQYFPDALLETIGVIIIGGLINLWGNGYRKEKTRRQRMLSELETAHRQLQYHTATIEENEKRLAAFNKISSTISQVLELSQILNSAVNNVADVMQADATWIYLMNQENTELVLAAHHGIYEEPARIKIGDGLNGRVVESGQPLFVGDLSQDPRFSRTDHQQMHSVLIVPLSSKGKVSGTLGVSSRNYRSFHQGEIELLIAISHQISVAMENARLYQRQREVAEELRVSEQRYRELFESAHDAIWVHDLDGNITAANRATETLGGYSIKELVGMNVRIFLAEESLNLGGQIKRKLFQGETVEQPYEQRLIRRDSSVAVLQLTTNLIRENGKSTGFLHIARDVTREKEMLDKLSAAYRELSESHQRLKESQEQLIQAEKLTSLGQLAASVAHEVNNPLSGILGYTQLLMKKITSDNIPKETALDYLSKMEFELIRSTKLIRNLLDFARQSPPAFRQVSINDVINRAFDLAAHSAELQHIHVIKKLDPSLPDIMADSNQLQQVCTNLILNAIQAMPAGGQLTLLSLVDNDQIRIEVQDTGCGISPENMRKIFTPFFTTKREVKGVGLGLAVAYGIIQRHKGKIAVQSKEDEGTTFAIYLPLRPEERQETG
jgi:PAS domain S-box-containing protein